MSIKWETPINYNAVHIAAALTVQYLIKWLLGGVKLCKRPHYVYLLAILNKKSGVKVDLHWKS